MDEDEFIHRHKEYSDTDHSPNNDDHDLDTQAIGEDEEIAEITLNEEEDIAVDENEGIAVAEEENIPQVKQLEELSRQSEERF